MNKTLSLLLCCLFCCGRLLANQIDDLKTDQEVADFVRSADTIFRTQYAPPVKVVDSTSVPYYANPAHLPNIEKWKKVDFNNDGRTDLLVMIQWEGYFPCVIIDKGHGHFQLIRINYDSFNRSELATVLNNSKQPQILFAFKRRHYGEGKILSIKETLVKDTLVYKFGNLIEFNARPQANNIVSVDYNTLSVWSYLASFTMRLDLTTGYVTYEGSELKDRQIIKRNLSEKINRRVLSNFTGVINYIDLHKIEDDYKVLWTDDDTATLTLHFKDGTQRIISDYGERGTFGLKALYQLFWSLREAEKWGKNKF